MWCCITLSALVSCRQMWAVSGVVVAVGPAVDSSWCWTQESAAHLSCAKFGERCSLTGGAAFSLASPNDFISRDMSDPSASCLDYFTAAAALCSDVFHSGTAWMARNEINQIIQSCWLIEFWISFIIYIKKKAF